MKATGWRISGCRFIYCNAPDGPDAPESIFSKKNIDILVELSYIPVAGKKLSTTSRALKKESLARRMDIRIVSFPAESNQTPRGKRSRYEMNVIISQQAVKNERSSRLSGIQHQTPFNPR
ncbi:MAG: hypothetical protein GX874_00905 [Smithella sp.]|nr:hypothetical protein [Smithella sp.]